MLLHNMMRGGPRVINPITISANTSNFNMFTAAGSPTDAVDVLVTINAGVIVSSSSTAAYAFDTGVFPAGSTLTLVNNGVILGRGGNGGSNITGTATAGASGGPALRAQSLISIWNNNRIAGGGGGGGGGGGNDPNYGAGGGGGGIGGSIGGSGSAVNGSNGTLTSPGTGGNPQNSGGVGGNGGSYGAAGTAGTFGVMGGAGGAGGAGGGSVVGNSNITWMATGTRNGAIT